MEIFAYYKIKCGKWDLGIVAGIIDEMELVEEVNKMVGIKTRENLTSGQVVKAMILNGLGFLSAPLYLFGEFFVGKPTTFNRRRSISITSKRGSSRFQHPSRSGAG